MWITSSSSPLIKRPTVNTQTRSPMYDQTRSSPQIGEVPLHHHQSGIPWNDCQTWTASYGPHQTRWNCQLAGSRESQRLSGPFLALRISTITSFPTIPMLPDPLLTSPRRTSLGIGLPPLFCQRPSSTSQASLSPSLS